MKALSLEAHQSTVRIHSWHSKYVKRAVVGVAIVLIWAVLTLPTVFYHLPDDQHASSEQSCLNIVVANGALDNTSQCFNEVYEGTICGSTLKSLQDCSPDYSDTSEKVFIASGGNQYIKEEHVKQLLSGLQLLSPSPECQAAIAPLLCSYYFGICDSTGDLYLPTFKECETVATGICANEFKSAVDLLGRENLPNCELLPVTSDSLDSEVEPVTSGESDDQDNVTAGFRTCSQGFYLDKENSPSPSGICKPDCGEWEEFPHRVIVIGDVLTATQAVVYLISAAVLFLISCVHHKRMFKFPAIFVVYEMFPLGLFSLFVLIGHMDRTKLFCSSQNLADSIANSTVFCNLQGGVLHYIALQQALMWFLHIVAVYWTVKFPLHAKSFEAKGYTTYVHIAMLALIIILPFISIAVLFGTGGCRVSRFPNIICQARHPDVTFYALVLPVSILTAAGISMIILLFWVLYDVNKDMPYTPSTPSTPSSNAIKEEGTLKRKLILLKQKATMTTAEVKILIIFIYFSIFLASILVTFTVRLHGINPHINEIRQYFGCEATGIMPGKVCNRSFERLETEIISIITFTLVAFYPIVSLIYVVNIQELKQKVFRRSRKESAIVASYRKTASTNSTSGV